MTVYEEVKIEDIREGDVVTAVGYTKLFQNLKVAKVEEDGSIYSDTNGFDPTWGWRYFLIERAKQPLPTKLGSVVKALGVEWVLCDPGSVESWHSPKLPAWKSNEDFDEIVW